MPAARTVALAVALVAGSASAQTTTVTINLDGTSQISATVSQDAPLIGGSDSFTTGLVGFAVFIIDEAAGTVSVADFMGMTTTPVELDYSGFGSNLSIDASTLTAEYAGFAPSLPVPYAGSAFDLVNVDAAVTGTATATGSIFGVVTINESFNFADFGAVTVPTFSGTLTNTGGDDYALASSFVIKTTQPFTTSGVTFNITVDATVTLNGTGTGVTIDPDPRCNAADVAPDFGVLNVNDVVDFVNGFNNANLGVADVSPFPAGDGLLNVNDIVDFVNAFNAGCP